MDLRFAGERWCSGRRPLWSRCAAEPPNRDRVTRSLASARVWTRPRRVLLPGLYVRARLIEGVRQQGLLAPQAGVTHNERGEATALVVGPGDKI